MIIFFIMRGAPCFFVFFHYFVFLSCFSHILLYFLDPFSARNAKIKKNLKIKINFQKKFFFFCSMAMIFFMLCVELFFFFYFFVFLLKIIFFNISATWTRDNDWQGRTVWVWVLVWFNFLKFF